MLKGNPCQECVGKADEQAERERRAEDKERADKSEAKFKAMKGKFFGLLFTIVRPTLEQCRAMRDEWLREKGLTN